MAKVSFHINGTYHDLGYTYGNTTRANTQYWDKSSKNTIISFSSTLWVNLICAEICTDIDADVSSSPLKVHQ